MLAYIFPGQGAQFTGMGLHLFETSPEAKAIFEEADAVLGFSLSQVMFTGSADELRQTNVTQPAIFVHSMAALASHQGMGFQMVAGHSLGEFSALVANKTLRFADALRLVRIRATAMQKACESVPGTMAAVLGLADEVVEKVCAQVAAETGEAVVAANYNCPGQLVISGSQSGVQAACEALKAAGAKRALLLPVGGAFHSPLMAPAREELAAAIDATDFAQPICPVYQNVVAQAVRDPGLIKDNLIEQLTGAVRWTQCVEQMIFDGAQQFIEIGPGKVLQGLVQKINGAVTVGGVS